MNDSTIEVLPGMTPQEIDRLRTCEEAIKKNIMGFFEVGRALMVIRDERLYRETHQTFEAYLKAQWDLSSSRGYELIKAHETVKNLSAIADKRPANEAQARPLALLDPDRQRQAWRRAVQSAPDGRVTARHVAAAVKELLAEYETSGSEAPAPPDAVRGLLGELRKALKGLDDTARQGFLARLAELVREIERQGHEITG